MPGQFGNFLARRAAGVTWQLAAAAHWRRVFGQRFELGNQHLVSQAVRGDAQRLLRDADFFQHIVKAAQRLLQRM